MTTNEWVQFAEKFGYPVLFIAAGTWLLANFVNKSLWPWFVDLIKSLREDRQKERDINQQQQVAFLAALDNFSLALGDIRESHEKAMNKIVVAIDNFEARAGIKKIRPTKWTGSERRKRKTS